MKPTTQVRASSPAEEPITVDEAKAQCRVTHTDDDVYFAGLIEAAREWAEEFTHRAFVSQTWVAQFEDWPEGVAVGNLNYADVLPLDRSFELPRPPLVSVGSVKYRDADDAEQTVNASNYLVETNAFPGIVHFKRSFSGPSLNPDRPFPVTVTFTAGWADADAVPARVKHALKLMVHHFYVNRVPVSDVPKTKVPLSVEALLGSLKRRNV